MADPADRSYRTSVLPFSGLLILGSLVLLPAFAISDLPIRYRPFIDDLGIQRAILAAAAAIQLLFGVGLAMRSRMALYGFLVYLSLATAFLSSAYLLEPPDHMDGGEAGLVSLFGAVVNGSIAIWLYSVRSVFR